MTRNRFADALRLLNPRVSRANARRVEELAAANRDLREQVRVQTKGLAHLRDLVTGLEDDLRRLAAARAGDVGAPERLDRLAAQLDRAATVSSIEAAVARAVLRSAPTPELVFEGSLLPLALTHALEECVPDPLFFGPDTEGRQELALPPRIAPLDSVAGWSFLVDVLNASIVPAVCARFAEAQPSAAGRRATDVRLREGGGVSTTARLIDRVITLEIPLGAHTLTATIAC